MIVSDTFWDWVKYETNAEMIADVCRVLAGAKDVDELEGQSRIMALTFRDHTAATVSAIETKRANWKRERAKSRDLSDGQKNVRKTKDLSDGQDVCPTDKKMSDGQNECPKDKSRGRTIQSINQPINQSTNQPIYPVGKPPGYARGRARVAVATQSSGPSEKIDFPKTAEEPSDEYTPHSLRVDYGTIFSDADPVHLAMELASAFRREDQRAFGALLRAIGDKGFRNILASMYGEMNAGEVPDNPAGALIAKLRNAEKAMKEDKHQ